MQMTDDLWTRILVLLRDRRSPLSAIAMAKELNVPRAAINQCLYKHCDQPMLWQSLVVTLRKNDAETRPSWFLALDAGSTNKPQPPFLVNRADAKGQGGITDGGGGGGGGRGRGRGSGGGCASASAIGELGNGGRNFGAPNQVKCRWSEWATE